MTINVQVKKYLLKIMRLSMYQVLIAGLFVSFTYANVGKAQEVLDRKITIQLDEQHIEQALQKIEQAAEVHFMYNHKIFKNANKVSLSFKNIRLQNVLEKVLTPYNLGYEVAGNQIIIKLPSTKGASSENTEPSIKDENADKTVSGTITDKKGEPLSGVTVVIKNTTVGVVTDIDGKFTINIPEANAESAVLVISYVGYTSQEVTVGNQTSISVQLEEDVKVLDDIIVVGYGTQKKSDVTGAVISIKSEELKEVPSPNLIDQMKGRVAGVSIISNGATPGSSGQIRIRGNRSIATSQSQADGLDGPLIVVDGIQFPGSINDINPEDILTVDILKDASATAIYGARGAGGVVLITTRRGRKDSKMVVSYEGYVGVSSVLDKYNVYNGKDYAQLKADAAKYNRTTANTSAYGLTPAETNALAAGVSTDWQDLIYTNGITTNHQLSINGGNEKTQYGTSIGYYRQGGIIPNQHFDRYTIRSTIDHNLNKSIKVGLNTLNTLSYTFIPGGSGVPSGMVRLTPLASPYNADGSVNMFPAIGSIDANLVSPLTLNTKSDAIDNTSRRLRTFNSLYAEVKILEGLRYRLNVGLDYYQNAGNTYSGPLTYVNTATVQSSSQASISNAESWNINIQHLLYYDKEIKKHKIGVTGLFELYKTHEKANRFTITGVPADYIKNSNFALASGTPVADGANTYFTETGLMSYMGRLNYAYAGKYLFTATMRVDAASTLAPGNQFFTYPAFGLGWNITEEEFMKNVNFLSNLKLRGGWGISGNRNVGAYSTLGLLSSGYYNFGTSTAGQQLGYLVTSLANNKLGWQYTSQWNIGLEFGMFKNRITGSLEVYEQTTKDILLEVTLPPSNGAGSTYKNLGETKGSGLEFALTSHNISTKSGFIWDTDFNFFFNREKIVQLTTPAETQNIANGWFVGQPLNVIYDYKKIGIWQTSDADGTGKIPVATQSSPVQYAGQIRVEDVNKDGKIDASDRQIIGNFQPNYEFGITNRLKYKGFDLSVVVSGRMGMMVVVPYLSADGGANGFPFYNQGRANQIRTNYWTDTNPTNDFPAPDAGTDRLNYGSTLAYRDGSFVRVRSINLGYTVPATFLKKFKVSTLRLYCNVTNPFFIYAPLVSSGLGIDPEGNGYGNTVGTGTTNTVPARAITVNLNNPSARMFTFGVNATF